MSRDQVLKDMVHKMITYDHICTAEDWHDGKGTALYDFYKEQGQNYEYAALRHEVSECIERFALDDKDELQRLHDLKDVIVRLQNIDTALDNIERNVERAITSGMYGQQVGMFVQGLYGLDGSYTGDGS